MWFPQCSCYSPSFMLSSRMPTFAIREMKILALVEAFIWLEEKVIRSIWLKNDGAKLHNKQLRKQKLISYTWMKKLLSKSKDLEYGSKLEKSQCILIASFLYTVFVGMWASLLMEHSPNPSWYECMRQFITIRWDVLCVAPCPLTKTAVWYRYDRTHSWITIY